MEVLAVVNHKGGSGKTNLTGNLAAESAALGKRVLAVDLDPQHTLTSWMVGFTPSIVGTAEVLGYGSASLPGSGAPGVRDVKRRVDAFAVDLVGSDYTKLTALQSLLATDFTKVATLGDALAAVQADYDLVYVDCPPSLGPLTTCGIMASTAILIPIDGSEALEGYAELEAALGRAGKMHAVRILGIVATKYRGNTKHFAAVLKAIESTGHAFETTIRLSNAAAELHEQNVPLRMYSKRNAPVHDDYKRLTREVFKRLGIAA